MNFQSIKSKFILHLKETSYLPQSELASLDISSDSIFSHQDEFKKFLKDEYKITDGSLFTMSIDDLMKMNIVDGKLVDTSKPEEEQNSDNQNTENEENTDDSAVTNPINLGATEAESETPTEENTENGWLSGFINDLFNNETFKNNVDGDKNGEIDETEFSNFLNYIKDLDGDKETLSLNDLFTSLDAMEKGTFNMTGDESSNALTPDTTNTTNPISADNSYAPTSSQPSSSSSHSSSGGSGSYSDSGSDTTSTPQPDNTPKSYDKMTEDELNQELSSANTELNQNKANLSAIANGTYSDGDLEKLKTAMDEEYEAYKTALDPQDQQELDKITSDITQAESNIAQKNVEISEQNNAISAAQANVTQAQATYDSYEAQVKELESKDTSKLTDEEKATLSSKKQEATKKRDEAKDKIEEAKNALEKEQEKLNTLNQELEALKTGENGLETLNAKKAEFEEKIKADPTASEKMTKYNEAKAQYDAKKEELKAKVEADYKASQDKINEINSAKQNLADKKDIDENLKFGSTGELFDPNAKLNMQYIKGGAMNYMLIAPDNVDPNEELPVMVFLHGSGEVGGGEGSMKKNFCPGGFMKNWGLNNFRGYIICPVLKSGAWSNSKAEKNLRSILNDFQSTHKVNKNRISLTGASLGGAGAVYMAKHMDDVFYRTAALSAYDTGINIKEFNSGQDKIRGYYGSRDDHDSINYMKKAFPSGTLTELKGAKHCQVPSAAFKQDNDGDNCSDLIQWLFGN